MILKELSLGKLGRSKSPILCRESSFQYEPCSVEGVSMYQGWANIPLLIRTLRIVDAENRKETDVDPIAV